MTLSRIHSSSRNECMKSSHINSICMKWLARLRILLFQIMTAHRRWQVFRGDSSSFQDLIFSVKKSSLFQLKTELHVFLASNTKEESWDFKVKGSWLERSCTIYARDEENVVAQVIDLFSRYSITSSLSILQIWLHFRIYWRCIRSIQYRALFLERITSM